MTKSNIIILKGNFGETKTARYMQKVGKEKADIVIKYYKSLHTIVPNIPMGVLAKVKLVLEFNFKFIWFLIYRISEFIPSEINAEDKSNELQGNLIDKLKHNFLVVVRGNRMAFDKFESFYEYGWSKTDGALIAMHG
jgi:hypothetical protein